MSISSLKLSLVFLLLILVPKKSEAEFEQWCVADEQTPDNELQAAMNWACGKGGADCSKIQMKGPCYVPNTVRDHANYAFNNYYQKFKNKGASCYFNGAAITTELDPSTAIAILNFFLNLRVCFTYEDYLDRKLRGQGLIKFVSKLKF